MKIVYGLSGEGSGHSSRAKVVLKHLLAVGHEVKIATYGRGISNLKDEYEVFEIIGLTIITVDNQVSKSKTLAHNLSAFPEGQERFHKLKKKLFEEFNPDCVITDFEPLTAYLANFYKIPLISMDNQHCIRYMNYPCLPELKASALLTENIVRAIVPRPCFSIITTFYKSALKNQRSVIIPPLLKEEILQVKPENDGHILVYLTQGFDSLIDLLKEYKREKFYIYGQKNESVEGNLYFKNPSNEEFMKLLASSKAVIGTSGFTLMTEAFYLKKPFLATPMKGQFEQEMNALMAEELGYGVRMPIPSKEKLSAFLYDLPLFSENLENYASCGNALVADKLDELLADDMKLLKEYHHKRSLNYVFESIFDVKKIMEQIGKE